MKCRSAKLLFTSACAIALFIGISSSSQAGLCGLFGHHGTYGVAYQPYVYQNPCSPCGTQTVGYRPVVYRRPFFTSYRPWFGFGYRPVTTFYRGPVFAPACNTCAPCGSACSSYGPCFGSACTTGSCGAARPIAPLEPTPTENRTIPEPTPKTYYEDPTSTVPELPPNGEIGPQLNRYEMRRTPRSAKSRPRLLRTSRSIPSTSSSVRKVTPRRSRPLMRFKGIKPSETSRTVRRNRSWIPVGSQPRVVKK